MSASKPQESGEVRFGHSLNKKEEEFVARRSNTVLQCLQKFKIRCSQDAVPNIALLGSGGGQRAMVGLLGSLVQLDKAGLLDCILYLSGVSGSTWCMASLYKEPDWSTKLETVKNKIIRRLSGPGVRWTDALAKLKNYYYEKDIFSLTDVWAVMLVTSYVKEATLCSSVLANEEEIWKWIKDPHSPPIDECYQVLLKLVDMNLDLLKGTDPSACDQFIRTTLTDLSGGQRPLIRQLEKLNDDKTAGKKAAKQYVMQYTVDVCDYFSLELKLNSWSFDLFKSICRCMSQWIWGRHYNFLHNMTDDAVPAALLESETRDYIDAGLLLNSPYFSVLREERDIDLIISLDFSDGDPFMTVTQTAETCKKLKIPFPEVNIPSEDVEKPKDFYVFKGQNAPTVIHIPLFNVVNCGDKIYAWRKKYGTSRVPYSAEMIAELMQVSGKNFTINGAKLLEQICVVAVAKYFQAQARQI
ncbi:cytosolic phospholipase A2 gamma-like [Sinocyclocheilus rhinocerous]|uniref:cytosolic phospholipase A2 gamma-like n=1 Tax=Sinocyclocheilus rhinocerous TaxID=307959 RepID=UPI0007B812C8|nr:PREDICTED: cytosolic phospholipase A2 gamma-like [Sinocyclocheilus rhinocerous]